MARIRKMSGLYHVQMAQQICVENDFYLLFGIEKKNLMSDTPPAANRCSFLSIDCIEPI